MRKTKALNWASQLGHKTENQHTLLQRFALSGNNFQLFPPCRPCLRVSEGHGGAVKLLSV